MQTGAAHFRDALGRQEPSHLVQKRLGGRRRRQIVQPLSGPCLDIRCSVIGKFSRDDVPVGLGIQLLDEIPNIPDVAVFQDFSRRQRDGLVSKDFVGVFDREDDILYLHQSLRHPGHAGSVVVGWHIGKLDLGAGSRRVRCRTDRHDNLPSSHRCGIALYRHGICWLLEGDLIGINVEIAMQRSLRGLQCDSNEPLEFNLFNVRSCLSAYEVQVFAVPHSAVAKTQCGTPLKYDMAKHAGIRQRRQQMKMNRLLD
jgi:hypothetical protein